MVDISSILLMTIYFLGAVLLVVLIILGIKLINTVTKIDNIVGDIEIKLGKLDKMLSIVDVITDGMALISDKVVDGIFNGIKKIFNRKKRKEEDDIYE